MFLLHEKHIPRKRFGQHFLTNEHIADRIVECADIGSEAIVLEIGPGKGILTERILKQASDVFAIEIDHDLVKMLQVRFGHMKGFHLIEADILSLDLEGFLKDFHQRIKVVANIPYNISSPIIELFIRNRGLISRAVIMVQKEVARRLLARPGTKDYGLATLNLALCAEGSRIMDVKPGSFYPTPEVMSSVISLVFSTQYRYPLENEEFFRLITGVVFRQRRKMLRNTLIPFLTAKGISEWKIKDLLISSGIDIRLRPESLDVGDFVRMSNILVKTLSHKNGLEYLP